IPACHEARISRFGLLDPAALLLTQTLDVVSMRRPLLAACGLVAGLEFEIAKLFCVEQGTRPRIALALGQQVPDHDSKFAGRRDGCDMLTATGPDPEKESPQRTRCPCCDPSRLASMPRAWPRPCLVIRPW